MDNIGETRLTRRERQARDAADAAGRLPQVFDLVVQAETGMMIERLAGREGVSPSEAASRLLGVGVQAEVLRQRWLAGMRALSPRMREAALLVLEGKNYGEVAAAMGIAYFTAHDYSQHAARAFGSSGRQEVVRRYSFLLEVYSRGELTPDY